MEENEDDKVVSMIINYFNARVNIAKDYRENLIETFTRQKSVWKFLNFIDKSLFKNSNGSRHLQITSLIFNIQYIFYIYLSSSFTNNFVKCFHPHAYRNTYKFNLLIFLDALDWLESSSFYYGIEFGKQEIVDHDIWERCKIVSLIDIIKLFLAVYKDIVK